MKNGYEEDMNLQKYNRMKKPANRLYMALALGAGICLTASCASDDGFAADEGALELQRIEVEGEESVTRAEAPRWTCMPPLPHQLPVHMRRMETIH